VIVVGADGPQARLRAVEWAAREAALREVPLHVVHALTKAWVLETPPDGRLAGVARWRREGTSEVLDQTRAAALAAAAAISPSTPLR
jgi:nucleotide-binding universal stress UspA family protein